MSISSFHYKITELDMSTISNGFYSKLLQENRELNKTNKNLLKETNSSEVIKT